MIYSNERKLNLSGWLKQNSIKEYNTPLKLQKFLLLYESFSKVAGENSDFDHLRGYKRGPVFSNVWGDYTKERNDFNAAVDRVYKKNHALINEERAKKTAFIVSTLSEEELSDLTHHMNLWNAKKERIMSGEKQVPLDESDFNENDARMIRMLDAMNDIEMIDSSEVIYIDDHYFVFRKKDIPRLTEQHMDTLMALSERADLHNPVYVDIDKKGRLIID